MPPPLTKTLASFPQMTVAELRLRYQELFGEVCRASNKAWLIKRCAWRLQALAEGDLSERARHRAQELAREADLRLNSPLPPPGAVIESDPHPRDPRLPPVGHLLVRRYKGQAHQVQLLEHGFTYQGKVFPSLSAVAKAITGSHTNGFLFFRLEMKGASS